MGRGGLGFVFLPPPLCCLFQGFTFWCWAGRRKGQGTFLCECPRWGCCPILMFIQLQSNSWSPDLGSNDGGLTHSTDRPSSHVTPYSSMVTFLFFLFSFFWQNSHCLPLMHKSFWPILEQTPQWSSLIPSILCRVTGVSLSTWLCPLTSFPSPLMSWRSKSWTQAGLGRDQAMKGW